MDSDLDDVSMQTICLFENDGIYSPFFDYLNLTAYWNNVSENNR